MQANRQTLFIRLDHFSCKVAGLFAISVFGSFPLRKTANAPAAGVTFPLYWERRKEQ